MIASVRDRASAVGRRRIASVLVVLVFLGLFVLTGGWRILVFAVAGWFENALGLFGEFEPAHRIHTLGFSLLIWPAIVGMLLQLRSPRKNVAAQLGALVPWMAAVLAFALTDYWEPFMMIGIMGSLTLLAAIVHPSGRELVASFDVTRASRVLLVLALVAAVPLLAFAATQIGLQTGAIEPTGHDHGTGTAHEEIHAQHVEHGHFALMTAFSFAVVGIALIASLRPTGWWYPAGVAGLLAAIYGVASLTFPEAASTVGTMWSAAAILWGIAFVVAAVHTGETEAVAPYGDHPERAVAKGEGSD